MSLSNGTRLGPYEITAPLGAGGMGEVYRAHDARLHRDVALKVLPPVFANDPERMARFQREAQVLAALNHPNIAALYGLEESDGIRALVMELVEGPTLAGPLPCDEALPLARQIADALEYAHEKGVIHRDLKPANIKVTPGGTVKVLDFGLALLGDGGQGPGSGVETVSATLTRAGALLGTAAYMPPEQAMGRPVDRRADIWSFGVVLFEMLTGRQIFAGQTAVETLAAVVRDEPPWEALPADTPAGVRWVLERCLEKDSRKRLRDIGEARFILEGSASQITTKTPRHQEEPRFSLVSWCLCGGIAVLVLALAAVSFLHFRETPPEDRVLRYSLAPPEKTPAQYFALSPDGRYLALAPPRGQNRLWVRALDALAFQALPGTEDAGFPFWSPDSRYIGFFAGGKLKKVAVTGGPPQTLCDAQFGAGGTWNRDGVILFVPNRGFALHRVQAVGGMPSPIAEKVGEARQRFPVFLPDGRHFLYSVIGSPDDKDGIYIAALDAPAGRRRLADVSSVVYAPPVAGHRHGHLLFVRDGTLMAQPFDTKTLQPAGEVFPVAEQVTTVAGSSWAPVAVSDNGTLLYQTGRGAGRNQLAWFDRSGKNLGPLGPPYAGFELALSPDEKRVAFPRWDQRAANSDIWLHELARGTDTRFTFHASQNSNPVWSPDGNRIVFSSRRAKGMDLYLKDTSGAGQDELLLQSANSKYADQWSRDGKFLVYQEWSPKARHDLWILPMTGERKPVAFLQTEFDEGHGQISPDGRWMVYDSDESGRHEVYVRPFPSGAGKWKVSTNGGARPRWRGDGKELFYLSPERALLAVTVKAGPPAAFEPGVPQTLFESSVVPLEPAAPFFLYDVTGDGRRFLIATRADQSAEAPLTLVVNWLAGTRK